MERLAPSARLEAEIASQLGVGFVDADALSELGRLGARLVLQRAIEEEAAAFLQRARYERRGDALEWRNGSRPRCVQTAEGEFSIAMPQVRGGAERSLSTILPHVPPWEYPEEFVRVALGFLN